MKKLIAIFLSVFFLGTFSINAQDEKWETVSIPEICTYKIPPSLEIQKGTYKRLKDQVLESVLEITVSPDRVVAQPKGINDFDPNASKRYCRVIVETVRGKFGDYKKLDDPTEISAAELAKFDKESMDQLQEASDLLAAKGRKMTILSRQPAKVCRFNGVNALLLTNTRSLNDAPPVYVQLYVIHNNDFIHHVTISYRESEKELWVDDLAKVINTFKFKKR